MSRHSLLGIAKTFYGLQVIGDYNRGTVGTGNRW